MTRIETGPAERANWPAVWAMTLGVFGLVTAEFLPASLLPPMAAGLKISEGAAGQAVTATALTALVVSLTIATLTRRIDRRTVLLAFSVLLLASNLLVAFAPSLGWLLLGRVLLGVALGGFWTMSGAVAMRLVPEDQVPRALSLIFSAVSVATVVAAPLGSYLGATIGWRAVFLLTSIIGAAALAMQFATLPRMAPSGLTSLRTLTGLLARPGILRGLIAVVAIFTGHFALFTFVRPFLEAGSGDNVDWISALLLGFGVANFIGTLIAGRLIGRNLRLVLGTMPLVIGASALGLVAVEGQALSTLVLIAIWGMGFGAVPVAWMTWVTRVIPDEAETGGGMIVAAIQLAIAMGAAVGGAIFSSAGVLGVYESAALLLLAAGALVLASVRTAPRALEV